MKIQIRKRWAYCLISLALLSCTSADSVKPEAVKVKNIIMIIGDGMGPQQVGLLLSYARQAPHSVIPNLITALDRMMEQGRLGISMTYTADTLVTDSAASATQLASGKFAGAEMLGLDKDGNFQENIIEKAKRMGKATGLVSDTRITQPLRPLLPRTRHIAQPGKQHRGRSAGNWRRCDAIGWFK
jgi:alkaline phosphatase